MSKNKNAAKFLNKLLKILSGLVYISQIPGGVLQMQAKYMSPAFLHRLSSKGAHEKDLGKVGHQRGPQWSRKGN